MLVALIAIFSGASSRDGSVRLLKEGLCQNTSFILHFGHISETSAILRRLRYLDSGLLKHGFRFSGVLATP